MLKRYNNNEYLQFLENLFDYLKLSFQYDNKIDNFHKNNLSEFIIKFFKFLNFFDSEIFFSF